MSHPAVQATRSLKLAFVLDPLDRLKPEKDSSIAMMRAAQQHGHQVFAIDSATLAWQQPGGVCADTASLELSADDSDWYRETGRSWQALTAFDAVIMRKDPPFDFEYLAATWLLERAEADGVRVFNRPRALRDHSEKLALLEFAADAPATLVSRQAGQINAFIDAEGDVILKPLDGMGGSQIFRVRRDDPNRNVIIETLTWEGRRTIMAQRYLPEIAAGDKRILVIAGQPAPYVLARIPQPGETRGNLAAGGTGIAEPISPHDRALAERIGPLLHARGLLLVGLDVIGDRLTEVNVTSPTCMVEIRRQTGYDAAGAFIAAIEAACSG
jgi:glutathione synthase